MWKSISFKFPLYYNGNVGNAISLPKDKNVETVVLLSKKRPDDYINISLDLEDIGLTTVESSTTYEGIRNYIKKKYDKNVTRLYIAQIKRKYGLKVGKNYHLSKKEDAKVPQCPKEKVKAIEDAMKHFQML